MKVIEFESIEEHLDFKLGKSGGSGLNNMYPSANPSKEQLVEYCKNKGLDYQRQSKSTKAEKMVGLTIEEMLDQLTAEELGIIKADGKKNDAYYKLVAERVAKPINPNDYVDRLGGRKFTMMARGHILEREAIQEFEKRNKIKLDNKIVVWQREDNEYSILSPDDAKGTKRAVEVKAFDTHRIIRAYDENHYPEECHEQIVKYFFNDELEVLHFVMYTDVMPALPYLQFDVKREDVENDIAELKAFEDSILKQVSELAERLAF